MTISEPAQGVGEFASPPTEEALLLQRGHEIEIERQDLRARQTALYAREAAYNTEVMNHYWPLRGQAFVISGTCDMWSYDGHVKGAQNVTFGKNMPQQHSDPLTSQVPETAHFSDTYAVLTEVMNGYLGKRVLEFRLEGDADKTWLVVYEDLASIKRVPLKVPEHQRSAHEHSRTAKYLGTMLSKALKWFKDDKKVKI